MQSHISLHQDAFEIQMLTSTQTRHAKTRCYPYVVAAKRKLLRFDLFAETFDCQSDAVLFGMRYDLQEFIAADTTAYIALSGIGFEDFSKLLEDGIASIVSIRIVYGLELV